LGIGDWGLGPIPNPQSPIPSNLNKKIILLRETKYYYKNNINYYYVNKVL